MWAPSEIEEVLEHVQEISAKGKLNPLDQLAELLKIHIHAHPQPPHLKQCPVAPPSPPHIGQIPFPVLQRPISLLSMRRAAFLITVFLVFFFATFFVFKLRRGFECANWLGRNPLSSSNFTHQFSAASLVSNVAIFTMCADRIHFPASS
jgi:hypothetical protein